MIKYNVRASVRKGMLTIEGEVPLKLLEELKNVGIMQEIQRYRLEENNLIFSNVRRGEVYLCEFGGASGFEQAGLRPAIVVQNNIGNKYSPTTLVIPCTKQDKKRLSVHYSFVFCPKNMEIKNMRYLGKRNVVLAEQVRVVDKRKLREYIGIVNDNVMGKIDEILTVSLDLRDTKSNDNEVTILKQTDTENKNQVVCKATKVLLELIGPELDKVSFYNSLEEKLDAFVNAINFPVDNEIVRKSFINVWDINQKVSYPNVLMRIKKEYPDMTGGEIRKILEKSFSNWPLCEEFKSKLYRASFISVLRAWKQISKARK